MTFSPKKKKSKSKTRIRTSAWEIRAGQKLLDRTPFLRDEAGMIIGVTHKAFTIEKPKVVKKPKKVIRAK
ncbi:MAG: hypothetical protein WC753_02195 [Candidatus Gracilibacteria bacterium]|jgi:hypothetical protein